MLLSTTRSEKNKIVKTKTKTQISTESITERHILIPDRTRYTLCWLFLSLRLSKIFHFFDNSNFVFPQALLPLSRTTAINSTIHGYNVVETPQKTTTNKMEALVFCFLKTATTRNKSKSSVLPSIGQTRSWQHRYARCVLPALGRRKCASRFLVSFGGTIGGCCTLASSTPCLCKKKKRVPTAARPKQFGLVEA